MEYTIYVNGYVASTAESLEKAVRKAKRYKKRGPILIETPSGNFSTVEELQQFLDREALFMASW